MLQGTCLCGKIRYEVTARPKAMYYCHCAMCRRASGSSFATNMQVPAEAFKVTAGESLLKAYESSPREFRYFCSECGSPMFCRAEVRPGLIAVRCGTLETDPGMRPTVHVFVGFKAPWYEVHDELRQYETWAQS